MPHLLYFVPTSGYDAAERERRLQVMRPLLAPGFTVDFLTLRGTPEFLDQASDFDAAKRAGLAGRVIRDRHGHLPSAEPFHLELVTGRIDG